MLISVIIPAYNEERYLAQTLTSIQQAKKVLLEHGSAQSEVIVVDNGSTDLTADLARSFGTVVVTAPKHNVASVRNVGVSSAKGDVLMFIDADTISPERLLWRISEVMANPACIGGAVDTDYRPTKKLVKIYLQLWRVVGKFAGMAQGATQFCRREVFVSLSGYDESLYMGEDVDFHWRLKQLAKKDKSQVCFIEDMSVAPSTRRFDQWPFWRTVIYTNPFYVLAFRRKSRIWKDWYGVVPR